MEYYNRGHRHISLEPKNATRYEIFVVDLHESFRAQHGLTDDTYLVAIPNFHVAAYMTRHADENYVAEKMPGLMPGDVEAITAFLRRELR